MKSHFKAGFVALAVLLAALTPSLADAEHGARARSHAASYHDRTPVAHNHGQHSGHHRS